MRKPVLVLGLVCLCATVALAQGKVANGWACGKPAMGNSIEVGDQPNHAYSIDQIKCTSTKGEIAGVKEKEGTGTEFADITGDSSQGHGVFVETMANGDNIHFTYQTTGAITNGQIHWRPSRSATAPVVPLPQRLEYAIKSTEVLGGVFSAIKLQFGSEHDKQLLDILGSAYQFRNKYIAHQEHATVSKDLAREQLSAWTTTLRLLYEGSIPVAAGRT